MDGSEINSYVAQDNIKLGRTTKLTVVLGPPEPSDQIRSEGRPQIPMIKQPKRKPTSTHNVRNCSRPFNN